VRNQSLNAKRREFVKASAAAAAGFVIVKPESVYGTPANDALTVGIIGSGGRGTGVGRDMIGVGARVVALHDLFDDKLQAARERLDKAAVEKGFDKIADKMLFRGPDAYRELLAAPGIDSILITSPPYFHPDHFEAVVDANKHVYLEKPVASDVWGSKRIEKAGRKGAGKIAMGVGFQGRFAEPYQEMVRRIHAGAIGDIVCAQTCYYANDLSRKTREGASPLENRLRNWVFDRVLSGDILVEQNIHVLDIVNWVMRSSPTSAQGTGGKKARLDVDCWDHYNVNLTYPNNVHVTFTSTQFKNGNGGRTQRYFGTRGIAEASFSQTGVRITGEEPWDAGVTDGFNNATMPRKLTDFFDSIRSGKLNNDIPSGVESTLTAILGRTAAYEKKEKSWDQVAGGNERWKERPPARPRRPC
jgi:myo-inositol 2-dehydrogenase/D-chiro-inositol 1-dehydrogenase